MKNLCFGITKNLNRCQRIGEWLLFCPEHRKQPIAWVVFFVFTIFAGSVSILSYFSKNHEIIQASYTLTSQQKSEFTHMLLSANDPKETIKLGCAGNDENACVFAGQLFDLFRESGWKVEGNKVERVALGVPLSGIAIFKRGEGKLDPTNPKSGLWVKQTNSLSIVQASFEKISLPTHTRAEANFAENVIGVFIGPYPLQ